MITKRPLDRLEFKQDDLEKEVIKVKKRRYHDAKVAITCLVIVIKHLKINLYIQYKSRSYIDKVRIVRPRKKEV